MPEDKIVTEAAPVTPQATAPAPIVETGGEGGIPTKPQTEVTTTAETPEYQPNYKFKALGEEREFDEWVRPFVKDSESEEKIRDFMSKAYGFELAKSRYEEAKPRVERLEQIEPQFNEMSQAVSEVLYARDNDDFDTLLQHLNIPEQKIAKWMLDKINRHNLPPEQKEVYDGYDTARREKSQLERRLQALEQNLSQQHTQARAGELNQVLSSPEIAQVAKDYDTRAGKPGSFRDTVIKFARAEWLSTNRDLSAEQAVQMVLSVLPPGQAGMSAPTQEKPLPVIPRTSGRAVSATTKIPSSIEDLKKMAKSMGA